MSEQVDGAVAHRLEERGQVAGQLFDAVALERPYLGGLPVPTLVQHDNAAVLGQRVDLQREVVRGARVAVHEHQRRACPADWSPAPTTPGRHR